MCENQVTGCQWPISAKVKAHRMPFRGKSRKNVRVLVNIHSVVVIDEAVPNRLAKYNPHDDYEKETDTQDCN